jgi:type IV pilus assembly protein PilM
LAPSWWPTRKRACVGLDLGTAALKAVELEQDGAEVALLSAAVAGTPAGALTEGALTDGIAVASGLKSMLAEGEVRTRNAAAGVGGDRVHCQSDVARGSDLEAFVREKAAATVGYSLDNACLGWQPVESMIEGSVLWTAAPVDQVDWARATASLAGRSARWIAPQVCALANVYAYGYEPSGRNAVLLLHVGARRLIVASFRGWAVAYSRDLSLTRQQSLSEAELPRRVIEAIEPFLDPLTASVRPYELELILLSGGPARSEALQAALRERAGIEVDVLDPFRKIGYSPSSQLGKVVAEHGPELAVAAGLALTGLENK